MRDSTYLDLSKLKYNEQWLISYVENGKPYSGKVAGWSIIWNRQFHIANTLHFGAMIYGWDEFGVPPSDKKVFIIGKVRRGKEVNTWHYYSEDGVLRAKSHFKKGLLEGKAEFYYENGKIGRTEEYKSGKLDGMFIEYDDEGNILIKNLYKEGHFIDTLLKID